MAAVTPINISAPDLVMAGTQVAGHLETAAITPLHALPVPAASSPVDVAAGGAVTAMQTKMTAMSGKLTTKSGELQTTTDAGAAAMQAQDANNASPLKDLASAIPSGGGGGGTSTGGHSGHVDSGNYHSGRGKTQAVDHTFKRDGNGWEQPMPDIGGEHIGGGGGRTPLEEGLGGPPGPPDDWWKNGPAPSPPRCSVDEFGGDVVDTAGATAGEIGLAAALPEEGPLLPLGGVALIAGAKTIGSDLEKTIDCLDKGIG